MKFQHSRKKQNLDRFGDDEEDSVSHMASVIGVLVSVGRSFHVKTTAEHFHCKKMKKNLERFTNLRVILAQGPC